MTFTNKAAYEMKERILSALYEIANYQEGHEDTKRLITELGERVNLPSAVFPEKAGVILSEILHGYEDFLISTIDKFNLKLIKSFNRDLNLPQEFEVILNETEILEKVIDAILAKVGTADHPTLTRLIENYTKKNLAEETNWNFKGQLIEFCSILSKERYIDIVEQLMKQEYLEEDLKEATRKQETIVSSLLSKAKHCYSLFIDSGLSAEEIPQKSNSTKPLLKLNGLTAWPDKGIVTPTVIKTLNEGKYDGIYSYELIASLNDLIEYYETQHSTYYKLAYYRDTFYNMALLQYVAKEMEEVRSSEQFIRISEFNVLISNLVRNQHAPYIYERLGNRLHHFLLDEFQDTSRMQWLNLIPLVEESIAKLNKNLIVGDAKQSIYRFNNGLAEQFVALPKIYNPEKDPSIERVSNFFESMGTLEEMENNFRSGKEIVSFNNTFFETFKRLIPQDAKAFYSAIHQHAIKAFDGYVEIKSIESSESALEVYPEILQLIEECLADGFRLGDICILNEKNGQGNAIAKFLTDHQYKVVSADSLLIHSDARIRLLISYLHIRNRTSNHREFMKFADLFLRLTHDEAELAYLSLFETSPDNKRKFSIQRFITTYFQSETLFFFDYTNLYDLVQKFFDLMQWKETDDVYLHHFADICFNFQVGKRVDLNSFLDYYKKQKSKLAIQLPKTNDAIQIMTIHKSKGLQFPVVIIPSIDFSINSTYSMYLMQDEDQVYYRKLSKNSPIPYIKAFSEREDGQYFMDKLNLLYVAMTRPVHRLYAFNTFKGGMGQKVHEILSEAFPLAQHDSLLHLTLGTKEPVHMKGTADEFYQPVEFGERLWYPKLVIRQGFDNEQTLLGKAFHELIASCSTFESALISMKRMEEESLIHPQQIGTLTDMLSRIYADQTYKKWTECAQTIRNEETIMDINCSLHRPDKIIELADKVIVIDFKTGAPNPSHETQIKAYTELLSAMYTIPIEAYLYYVQRGDWVPC
jgi:ATP-dependent exoDNAse (exonuclease V) beta subunit